ncbi:MAG: hypothetical protein ACK4R0_00060 [Blastomonas sp.]
MVAKLNRDQILRGILQTLVDGWGQSAVKDALESIDDSATENRKIAAKLGAASKASAVAQIEELQLPAERRSLLQTLALRYDEGSAFPKLSDARAFLISHQRDVKEIKTRSQAFKRMLPILQQMSEKGLEKVISRSHHSGPAELDPISKAIRGAGEDMRGSRSKPILLTTENELPTADDLSPENEPVPPVSGRGHGDTEKPISEETGRARLSLRQEKPSA